MERENLISEILLAVKGLQQSNQEILLRLDNCLTKKDAENFVTKDDLKRFATKNDLKKFATKKDLEKFATKKELNSVKLELQKADLEILQAMNEFSSYVEGRFNQMDLRFEKIEAQFEKRFERIEAQMVTKDYLDEKLNLLRGDFYFALNKMDKRICALEKK